MPRASVSVSQPRPEGQGLGGPVVIPHAKVRPPMLRDGQVRRTSVLQELDADPPELVLVLAPAGFGKTTMISQWASSTDRVVAWATASETDVDPIVLISTILAALRASGVDPTGSLGVLTGDEPAFSRRVLPQFQRVLESLDRPVTLVIDDVHVIDGERPAAVICAVLESLPHGSALALAGRSRPDLPVPLWRSQGRVREIGPDELAFDLAEASSFLGQLMHTEPTVRLVGDVMDATGGWPVAVYLQGLAAARGRLRPSSTSTALTDYLDAEVLGHVDTDLVDFLRRASVLSTLSAAACNDVVEVRNSRELLRAAERATLLINRLHGDGGLYRLHPLLRERLALDLEENGPQEAGALHARAARWCDAHGYTDDAIGHAVHSGDPDLLGTLAWRHAPEALAIGRTTMVQGWFAAVPEDQMRSSSSLCITAAWTAVGGGDGVNAFRWAEATGNALGADWQEHLDRSSVEASLALLYAMPAMDGYDVSAARMGRVSAALPITHVFRPLSLMFQGAFLVLSGAVGDGIQHLERGEALCESLGLGTIWVECASMLAAAHAESGAWDKAEAAIAVGRRVWHQQDLRDVKTTTMLVSGVSAYLQARAGRADEALVDIERAEAVLSGVAPVAPWAAVIVESFIARSWLLLEDRSASLATAARARAVLEQLPASPFLQELLDSAERAITSSDELAELTRAELRVWPLLVGRFTMREIAAQLHVSPETIKSQVASIYRKLGVSTRRELQERADAFGGLPDV